MAETSQTDSNAAAYLIRDRADMTGVETVAIQSDIPLTDYQVARRWPTPEPRKRLGDHMLLSWYDRDRDFESLQHSSEWHLDSAIPGYVDYGTSCGAKLMLDFEDDRFMFFICHWTYRSDS